MRKTALLFVALSAAGVFLAAGRACAADGAQRAPGLEPPRPGAVDEAFLPVPRELYESSFPLGGLYRIPDDPRARSLVKRAGKFEQKKQWQSAANAYALAYERAGSGTAAPYILFKRCVLEGDVDTSVAGLTELIRKFPSFPLADAVRLELAERLALRGRYDEGLGVLSETTRGPFAPHAASLSGELYRELGRHGESLQSYEKAREGLAGDAPDGAAPFGGTSVGAAPVGDVDQMQGSFPQPDGGAGVFMVRAYLGMAKTLIAKGDETARADARELLRRIAGTDSHPFYQAEALALLRGVCRPGEEPESVVLADEGLLRGALRIGPDGKLLLEKGPPELPRDRGGSEASKGSYAVQIGSFGIRENAEGVMKEVEGKGFSGFLSEAVVGGKTRFRVNVGPFADIPSAEGALKRLTELGYAGFVVRER